MPDFKQLPINAVLNRISETFSHHRNVVLQAPPGAGKTTAVPLYLLQAQIFKGKIIMLEPRRMAAKNVAIRMAQLLGETVGNTVGYRIRQETNISKTTKIEVVTGGVLNRMLMSDPSLEEYSLVIFDEFHERNLDADLALTLVKEGAELLREVSSPLSILVMSATLDADPVAHYLGENTPLISSEGRSFPVEVYYEGRFERNNIVNACADTIQKALTLHSGDILVFLPGQKEIQNLQQQLELRLRSSSITDVFIAPLFGALPIEQQQKAIEPLPQNSPWQRKIVLATDIAETSLTIQGITVVVDSGLRREPVFDSKVGMTRLNTVRISKASAEQRAGRAGRLIEGTAYRLWAREDTLTPFHKAEIENADLAPLLLQILAWGAESTKELQWLSPPPTSALEQALKLLTNLGAVRKTEAGHQLTDHGLEIARFPAHPRLAHMMIKGDTFGFGKPAAHLAALYSEANSSSQLKSSDINDWLKIKSSSSNKLIARQIQQFLHMLDSDNISKNNISKNSFSKSKEHDNVAGILTALAYPDRIAQKRHSQKSDKPEFLLANGRAAFTRDKNLASHAYLAVAELGGHLGKSTDQIFSAAPLSQTDIYEYLDENIEEKSILEWSVEQDRFIAEKMECIGAITLKRKAVNAISNEEKSLALCQFIQSRGLEFLNWSEECQQWLARLRLCYRVTGNAPNTQVDLPDLTDDALLKNLSSWLGPYLISISKLSELKKLDLLPALQSLIDWPSQQFIERFAPPKLELPSGREALIDYLQEPPVLSGKLQEFFGLRDTPSVANGQIKLTIHLLSPAGRPLQVTQNLHSFWLNAYQEVKKEMKGRYPKHPWPDDPLTALATAKTKKRM